MSKCNQLFQDEQERLLRAEYERYMKPYRGSNNINSLSFEDWLEERAERNGEEL